MDTLDWGLTQMRVTASYSNEGLVAWTISPYATDRRPWQGISFRCEGIFLWQRGNITNLLELYHYWVYIICIEWDSNLGPSWLLYLNLSVLTFMWYYSPSLQAVLCGFPRNQTVLKTCLGLDFSWHSRSYVAPLWIYPYCWFKAPLWRLLSFPAFDYTNSIYNNSNYSFIRSIQIWKTW